jgi:hypothetical protein
MADVDWDKVVWDEPAKYNPAEGIPPAKPTSCQDVPRMGDAVAWDEPTQSTPVEEVHEVAAAAMAHAIQQQTAAPLSDSSRLVVGDYIRVKDGCYQGWHGRVQEVLEDRNQVRATLLPSHHGGCPLPLSLEYWQVERVPEKEQRPDPEEVKKVVQWADRHGCLQDTVPGHAEWAQREGVAWPAGLTEAEKEAGQRLGMDVEGIDRWLRAQCEDIRRHVEVAKVSGDIEKAVQWLGEQVDAVLAQQETAPLPESLHPGNEGLHLPDENGVRTLKATAHPESLHVRVGNLEIVAAGKPGAAGIPFCGNSRILVDGKSFPVKSLVLRGNVDGLWTVELEFYPRQPKE